MIKLRILAALLVLAITGCSNDNKPENTTYKKLYDLISSYKKSIQAAPNKLAYSDITAEYEDSIENFLWSNAPFMNWEGTLQAVDTNTEVLMGREATEVLCIININIAHNTTGSFLLSFYEKDNPLAYTNIQKCPIGSKVYFGFVPWQMRRKEELQNDIINSKFDMLGGLFYIGENPQSYSANAQKIVSDYDSLRIIHPNEYIRIEDSIPDVFEALSKEEQVFINTFRSFRNIYDTDYPRPGVQAKTIQ